MKLHKRLFGYNKNKWWIMFVFSATRLSLGFNITIHLPSHLRMARRLEAEVEFFRVNLDLIVFHFEIAYHE